MADAELQEIITNDNLNASVDAQVYFRVKSDGNFKIFIGTNSVDVKEAEFSLTESSEVKL